MEHSANLGATETPLVPTHGEHQRNVNGVVFVEELPELISGKERRLASHRASYETRDCWRRVRSEIQKPD